MKNMNYCVICGKEILNMCPKCAKMQGAISDSKFMECDLYAVNFEKDTIEIQMPKNWNRNSVYPRKVKIDISGILGKDE